MLTFYIIARLYKSKSYFYNKILHKLKPSVFISFKLNNTFNLNKLFRIPIIRKIEYWK